uniref:RxLR effector candidate protein n=1 Tax=Hyaloperonospora arabidopsidis (strain Emoy2) TaxID=559515 RepID=M4BHT6_HYAAE
MPLVCTDLTSAFRQLEVTTPGDRALEHEIDEGPLVTHSPNGNESEDRANISGFVGKLADMFKPIMAKIKAILTHFFMQRKINKRMDNLSRTINAKLKERLSDNDYIIDIRHKKGLDKLFSETGHITSFKEHMTHLNHHPIASLYKFLQMLMSEHELAFLILHAEGSHTNVKELRAHQFSEWSWYPLSTPDDATKELLLSLPKEDVKSIVESYKEHIKT